MILPLQPSGHLLTRLRVTALLGLGAILILTTNQFINAGWVLNFVFHEGFALTLAIGAAALWFWSRQ